MTFVSAHKSKGLEATNVIIINGENATLGFPNKMADDFVLSFVLTKADSYEFAEERRLFYVALTRTKNRTYILAPDKNPSIFVKELIKNYGVPLIKLDLKNSIDNAPPCPKCLVGHLVERSMKKGGRSFVGCSNFPKCDYTLKDLNVLKEPKRCSVCGGYMVKRRGKYGYFYGCSNYPLCENKEKILKP
jgi:DNA helicase-4